MFPGPVRRSVADRHGSSRQATPRHPRAVQILLLASIAALSLGTGACAQILEIDDYKTGEAAPATSACGLPYGTRTCASCAKTNCCDESSACAATPWCRDYETCWSKCGGDPKCRAECTLKDVGDSPEVSALSACLARKCDEDCELECGGVGGYLSEPETAASCQECFARDASACGNASACFSSSDCDAFVRCSLGAHVPFGAVCSPGAGAPLASPMLRDWTGTCAADCAAGRRWGCVGQVNWRKPESPTVALTYFANDFSGPPVPGLAVSVHNEPLDLDSAPLGEGEKTTDKNGLVEFDLDSGGGGADFGLDGYFRIAGDPLGYGLQLLWWGFPLSRPVLFYPPPPPLPVLGGLATEALTQALYHAVYDPLRVTFDPDAASIAATVYDCAGIPAPDVVVTLDVDDPLIARYYSIEPGVFTATTSDGVAMFLNVPPGFRTLTATPNALLKASRTKTFPVRANAWNAMWLTVHP